MKITHTTNNILKGKFGKNITKGSNNNIGVFQGSPISAQLFIIYDDYIMENYSNDIRKENIINNRIIIKNDSNNETRSEYMMKINDNNAELPLFKNNNNDAKAIICDYAIYADDANIEFNKPSEIPIKIRTYDNNIKTT